MEQVAVTTGQLYTVKASLLGTDSGINEALFHDFDFLDRHLVGRGATGSYSTSLAAQALPAAVGALLAP